MKPRQLDLDLKWAVAAEREKRSRTMFAQQAIRVDEVAAELEAARSAIGSGIDVAAFMCDAVRMHGGVVGENGAVHFDLTETPRGLRDLLGKEKFAARYELPVKEGQLYLTRTHPLVESLAAYVMNTALDTVDLADDRPYARRAGAIRTAAVQRRTTLLLLRFRYHLITKLGDEERQLLAEDSLTLAFECNNCESLGSKNEAIAEVLHQNLVVCRLDDETFRAFDSESDKAGATSQPNGDRCQDGLKLDRAMLNSLTFAVDRGAISSSESEPSQPLPTQGSSSGSNAVSVPTPEASDSKVDSSSPRDDSGQGGSNGQ